MRAEFGLDDDAVWSPALFFSSVEVTRDGRGVNLSLTADRPSYRRCWWCDRVWKGQARGGERGIAVVVESRATLMAFYLMV